MCSPGRSSGFERFAFAVRFVATPKSLEFNRALLGSATPCGIFRRLSTSAWGRCRVTDVTQYPIPEILP
jgi:hypothetical protein